MNEPSLASQTHFRKIPALGLAHEAKQVSWALDEAPLYLCNLTVG